MLFKRFLKIIALVRIYQLAKFGDLISCGTTNHNDVTDLVNQGWLKIQKFEYLENGTLLFYKIKKFLTCASDDTFWVLRSYRFVVKLTFKKHFSIRNKTSSDSLSSLAHKFWELLLNSTKNFTSLQEVKTKINTWTVNHCSCRIYKKYVGRVRSFKFSLSFCTSGFVILLLDHLYIAFLSCTSFSGIFPWNHSSCILFNYLRFLSLYIQI